MTTAVAEPAPANTETETAEPNFDADSIATFDKVKATQVNEPESEDTPAPPAKATPAPKPETKPEQKPKAEPAKPDAPEIPEELLTGKPATPKAEPTEVEKAKKYEPPANLSEKGKANWGVLRSHAEAVEAENATLKAQLEQAKTKPVVDEKALAEVKTHKQRVAELEATLERKAFEESPKFKSFLTKSEQTLAAAKKYLKGSEIKPEVIDVAAKLEGADRISFLKEHGVDSEMIGVLAPYLASIDSINGEKQAALDNHKELAKEYEAQDRAAQERKERLVKEEEMKVFQSVGNAMKESIIAYKRVPGADKWNAQADELEKQAARFFGGEASIQEVAEAAYAAPAVGVLQKLCTTLQEKVKSQAEQLGKLTVAQPTGGESGTTFVASNDASLAWDDPANVASRFEQARARVGAP